MRYLFFPDTVSSLGKFNFVNFKEKRNVTCQIWDKCIFSSRSACVSRANWHFLFWSRCSEYRVSSESAMHSIIWRADARSNYSNCEGDAAAYPSPCSRCWKDEMRRSGRSARERTGYTGKSYIKPYLLCSSVIHLPQHPPTYGLPSPASIPPVRISTLLYLIQSRLYSAGWLRIEGDPVRLCLSASLQKLRIATCNKRYLRETRWINLAGFLGRATTSTL